MERPLRQGMKPVKTEAEAEAIAKKDYKEHIRREGPAGNIIDKNLEGVVEKWTDRQKVAKSADPPQRCCIRSKTDELEGTLEHVNLNMRSCARKGCYSHPLPIDAIYFALPVYVRPLPISRLMICSRDSALEHKIDTLGCQWSCL